MKLKHLFKEIDERLLGREFPLMSVSKIRGVVSRAELADDEGRAVSIENYKLCRPGDLVINRMAAYQGALGIAFAAGAVSPDYTILRGPAELTRFLYFFLKSSLGLALVTSLLKGIGSVDSGSVRTPRLNWRDLGDIEMLIAPVEELSKALDLLEEQTSQIDRLIFKKEQLIQKLLERRQALITHVVTKGLDPNAPMKDSGVGWIGEIPVNWTIKGLRYLANTTSSPVDKKLREGQQIVQLCNYTNVTYNDNIVPGLDFMVASATLEQVKKYSLRKGDTVITKDSETAEDIGLAAFVETEIEDLVCGYHLCILRPHVGIHPKWLTWASRSMSSRNQFTFMARGLTRVSLGQGALKSVLYPLPPKGEQKGISDTLDNETSRIDILVAKTKKAIELLKERRQALITQVVTGKIDVRGFAGGNS